MQVDSLELFDFRNYPTVNADFGPGLTAVVGPNGQGKTNLLEAIGYASGMGSLRGAPDAVMVREGCEWAALRCRTRTDTNREMLIEARIARTGRNLLQVNRQRVTRRSDLRAGLAVTVFSPDDLELIKGGPANRREWIDDVADACEPGPAAQRLNELERILRQRNALLRQCAGRLDQSAATTLEVWDAKLTEAGERVRMRRRRVLSELGDNLDHSYERVAGEAAPVSAAYVSSWGEESLAEALLAARRDDLRRSTTTVGPHRDDVAITLGGLPARTHASQGEQRSLALALRLAGDAAVRARRGVSPVLLLDDVFSELDERRSAGLLRALPLGQCILTTAAQLPPGAQPEQVLKVRNGTLETTR